ncbi:stalk domain-containing protein [Lysinibacillus sp. NPDC058147]|uniref:stalk domain-containing protein n=1 Tax=unclassified Lysinibacillus TaxID=2636778 RepID=UPI0036D9FFE1
MKKSVILLFSLCLAFLFLGERAEAATPSVYIDGRNIPVSTATRDNSTLVPLRIISEKLGLTVKFDENSKTIIVSHPFQKWELHHTVGTKTTTRYENGYQSGTNQMNTVSLVENGVTYVPIRFFEGLDAQVNWDSAKNRIDVYSYELKMNQYLILTSLAYNKLENYADNQTTLDKIFPQLSVGYDRIFNDVKNRLWIYTDYTPEEFASEMLMGDWVVKTVLTKSDFSTDSEYTKYKNSGFTGYTFRNIRTKEVVISYRGTDGFTSLDDWYANKESFINKSNTQKPYALQLFLKSISNGGYITIVGHSLGGNLAQGVASYYPNNYNKMVTFNALGSGLSANSTEFKKATNHVINVDPVKALRSHYGKVISYQIRKSNNNIVGIDAHELFNFYSYFFKSNSKYWTNGYGVPLAPIN